MPTKNEANRRHAAHYLELAAQYLRSGDKGVLHLNAENIRLAIRELLAALTEAKVEDFYSVEILVNTGHIDRLEGAPCPAIESGGLE